MFIGHGEWIRKNTRWIFAIILIILIPGFIALFTTTGGSRNRPTDLPMMRGKPVAAAEYEQARNVMQAQFMINSGRRLTMTAEVEDQVNQQAVFRMLVLRKAKEFGIRVSDDDVVRHIRAQFVNQAGQYDPDRQRQFLVLLNTEGISEQLFEEVMREDLIVGQLQALVTAGAKVTPEEVRLAYEPLHETVWIDLVAFNAASNTVTVSVTDDEARAFYEKNKTAYRIPKQMKVRYAFFAIDNAKKSVKITDTDIADFYERNRLKYADTNSVAKPLDAVTATDTNNVAKPLDAAKDTNTNNVAKPLDAANDTNTNNVARPLDRVKDRVREDLLQSRADRATQDRATELTVKLVQEPGGPKPDFVKLCSDLGVVPKETDFFGPTNNVPGIEAGPQFNEAAFALSPEAPFSDPVPGQGAYYVLEYLASKPSQIPPFEQVKTDVLDLLRRQKVFEATIKQGQDDVSQVKKLIAGGKTFDQACAELNLKITSVGPFSLSDEKPDLPAVGQIHQVSLGMATNAVSDFVTTAEGGIFFRLKDRKPADPAEFEKGKAQMAQQLLLRDRQAMFQFWVNGQARAEQISFAPMRSRPAQPSPEETAEPETAPPTTSTPDTATAPAKS